MSEEVYAGPERRQRNEPRSVERRKPGRPRLSAGEPTLPVSVRLPQSLHDLACQHALRQDMEPSAVIRHALELFLRTQVT
jgi:hypothetical protein